MQTRWKISFPSLADITSEDGSDDGAFCFKSFGGLISLHRTCRHFFTFITLATPSYYFFSSEHRAYGEKLPQLDELLRTRGTTPKINNVLALEKPDNWNNVLVSFVRSLHLLDRTRLYPKLPKKMIYYSVDLRYESN